MGLIKMATAAVRSALADQVLDFFYCDKLPDEVLLKKGKIRNINGTNQSRYGVVNNASQNVISDGSIIAVNEGQGIILVEDGEVVDLCMEAGHYRVDKMSEPSVFAGRFGHQLVETFKTMGKRFTFGGDVGKDQRVYFVNLRPIMGGKFGSKSPIDYLDNGISLRLAVNGTYNLHVSNPLVFYSKVAGNVADEYSITENLVTKLKSDIISSLSPALQSCAVENIPYPMLLAVSQEKITARIKQKLISWDNMYGVGVNEINVEVITPIEDENLAEYKALQVKKKYADADVAVGGMNKAMQDRMSGTHYTADGQVANNNDGTAGLGDAVSMVGMAMMGNMMKTKENTPFVAQNNENLWECPTCKNKCDGAFCGNCGTHKPTAEKWNCSCGTENIGNFCEVCGSKKPNELGVQEKTHSNKVEWVCECGTSNTTKFCGECGKPKPVVKKYRCDKCGFLPENPENPPKFCPECGDKFSDEDLFN